METIKLKLKAKNISFIIKRDIPGQDGQYSLYFVAKTITNYVYYIELKFKVGMNVCKVTVKSTDKAMSELCKVAVGKLLL